MSENLASTDDEGTFDIVDVDIRGWVEAVRHDQTLYRDRQVTEIVLTAIGLAPTLKTVLVLKGGTLMALAFKSERVTGDVDFTAEADPAGFDELLFDELDKLLPRVAIRLGYLDLICSVQSVKKMPRSQNFAEHDFPALRVRIGSARRGTREEARLRASQAPRVLDVEISFRDQVYAFQELTLAEAGVAVRAFTVHEIIAEKLRALLQQPIRNRYRRQDIYDIGFLLDLCTMGKEDLRIIHQTFVDKCRTRDIVPAVHSLDDQEVIRRARADWDTMTLELKKLPLFDDVFASVRSFYVALPWE